MRTESRRHDSSDRLNLARPVWSVGLMTGTALDGNIDVALLKTDGEQIEAFGPSRLVPYETSIVSELHACQQAALDWQFAGPEPLMFRQVEQRFTRAQAAAVKSLLLETDLGAAEIACVGFHGHTVLHRRPNDGARGQTRQLGDGKLMANLLGIPVVHDFRTADVVAGGEGAPLSAIYHRSLLEQAGCRGETAVLNLGGVANISWWDGEEQLIAFDTGPANAPMNDFMRSRQLGDMDIDGALAAAGHVDEDRLQTLLQHPYLQAAWPKSLDRFDFSSAMADGLSDADGAALLTAFCAAAVGLALDQLPRRPERVIVCGGGRHNATLMQAIEKRAAVVVVAAEDAGWRGDSIEAECFACLAVRRLRQLPISFPATTGVPKPLVGGQIVWPDRHGGVA